MRTMSRRQSTNDPRTTVQVQEIGDRPPGAISESNCQVTDGSCERRRGWCRIVGGGDETRDLSRSRRCTRVVED